MSKTPKLRITCSNYQAHGINKSYPSPRGATKAKTCVKTSGNNASLAPTLENNNKSFNKKNDYLILHFIMFIMVLIRACCLTPNYSHNTDMCYH